MAINFTDNLVIFTSIALLSACGGRGDEVGADYYGNHQATVVGSAGGVIESKKYKLTIPPGALSKDEEISVEIVEDVAAEFSGRLDGMDGFYRLEPNGLKFSSDVEFKFYLPESDVGDGFVGVLWSDGKNDYYPFYRRDGDYIVVNSGHFSFVGPLSLDNLSGKIFSMASALDDLYAGSICKIKNLGDVGQKPCYGHKNDDGVREFRCFGKSFSSTSTELRINPRTGLCWDPVLPSIGEKYFTTSRVNHINGNLNAVNFDTIKIVTQSKNGYLEFHGNGYFSYEPYANFIGIDRFTVSAKNEIGEILSEIVIRVGQPYISPATDWLKNSGGIIYPNGNGLLDPIEYSLNGGEFGNILSLKGVGEGYYDLVAKDYIGYEVSAKKILVTKIPYFINSIASKRWISSAGQKSCKSEYEYAEKKSDDSVLILYGCGVSGTTGSIFRFYPIMSPGGYMHYGNLIGYGVTGTSTYNGFTIDHKLISFSESSFVLYSQYIADMYNSNEKGYTTWSVY